MCEMLRGITGGLLRHRRSTHRRHGRKKTSTLTTLIVAIHDAHKAGTASTGSRGPRPERVPGQPEAGTALGPGARLDACTRGRTGHDGADPADASASSTSSASDFVPGARTTVVRGYHVHFHDERLGLPGHGDRRVSREVVGWSVADHMREGLVIDAFRMTVANPSPRDRGVVFHSDRGSQYTGGRSVMCVSVMVYIVGRADRDMLRRCGGGVVEHDVQERARPPACMEGRRACEAGFGSEFGEVYYDGSQRIGKGLGYLTPSGYEPELTREWRKWHNIIVYETGRPPLPSRPAAPQAKPGTQLGDQPA